jgi:catechol 2,3-dioxygenase-like lactoylglutathione lyase family enzyme
VKYLFHPTHWVPDLDEATRFFGLVFGRRSQSMTEFLQLEESDMVAGYPVDYSTFTPIAEVLFDCVDPTRHLVDGQAPYPAVREPHLGGIGWFVDGIEDLWVELRRQKIRGTDQGRNEPEGEGPPLDISSTPIIFTLASDTGLSYEFCPYMPSRDPRGYPPVPDVSPSDPLGIERCSHHTVLTNHPDRALQLVVDVLGGRVIHEGGNAVLGTQSTYVALADGVYEYGQPLAGSQSSRAGSPGAEGWSRDNPRDTYHSLTWQVRDLDQVARHLQSCGVRTLVQTDTTIVTDPADTLGIPWGFTTALTPGDSRAGG